MAYDKVVDSAVLDKYFSDIADAIRDKDKSQNTYTPADMAQAIEDIPSGGMDENFAALLAGTASGDITIKGVENLAGTKIRFCGFSAYASNEKLETLTMPDLKGTMKDNSTTGSSDNNGGLFVEFTSSIALRELHLPKCTTLAIKGNSGMKNLTVLEAPLLEAAVLDLQYAKLTELNFEKLANMGNSTFAYNSQLETVNLPELTNGLGNGFRNCTALKNVNLPKMGNLQGYMFAGCSSLEQVILPKGTWNGYSVFADCTALKLVDVFYGGSITDGYFSNSALEALVMRASQTVSLTNTNAFTNTPIASGTGYIYVPRDKISVYESATNWSNFAGQFRAIEDYTDDGTLTGEFIMPA